MCEDSKAGIKVVYEAEVKAKSTKRILDEVLDMKGLVNKNGTLEKLETADASEFAGMDTKKLIAKAQEMNEKVNPLDPIVRKLADRGYDPSGAFDILDDNFDEVLTLKEIKDGFD